jgi:hypothetical protein
MMILLLLCKYMFLIKKNIQIFKYTNIYFRGGGLFTAKGKPSARVLGAWHDLTEFLQEFFDNNFSKPELKRVVNESEYYERFFRRPPDMGMAGTPNVFRPDRRLTMLYIYLAYI